MKYAKETQWEFNVICVMTNAIVVKNRSLEIHTCLHDKILTQNVQIKEQLNNAANMGYSYAEEWN